MARYPPIGGGVLGRGMALLAAGLIWLGPPQPARAGQPLCHAGMDSAEAILCRTLEPSAEASLSEQGRAALAALAPALRAAVTGEIGQWAELVSVLCDRPNAGPAANASEGARAQARFQCRGLAADAMSAYLEVRQQAGGFAYRWRGERGDGFAWLMLTPQLAHLSSATQDGIDHDQRRALDDSGARRRGPPAASARLVTVLARIFWATPSLVVIEQARERREGGEPASSYRYVALIDGANGEEIENFSILFERPDNAIVAVYEYALAQLMARPEVRSYTYFTAGNLRKLVGDLRHWRFDAAGVTLLFDTGDVAPQALGEAQQRVPLELLLPYVKKDGPLGRALDLQ